MRAGSVVLVGAREEQGKVAQLYTRSRNGNSLTRSGLRALSGGSLRWSAGQKEKELQARKEATLALVEAAKQRKERVAALSRARAAIALAKVKARHASGLPRVRYRGRMTWHRLSGSSMYKRTGGNGLALIREVKSATQAVASERVRLSLHNARFRRRAATQPRLCLFFTRFGRCTRPNCRYTHDSSKVAVCGRFLRGVTCDNGRCNLVHEAIPDRMPDCSFFAKGVCSHDPCQYRHVHVGQDAPVCEDFLEGHCALGNQCPKKHTYECQDLAIKGKCEKGSSCRLYHPEAQGAKKGHKRKAHDRGSSSHILQEVRAEDLSGQPQALASGTRKKLRRYFLEAQAAIEPPSDAAATWDRRDLAVESNPGSYTEWDTELGVSHSTRGARVDKDPTTREDVLCWFGEPDPEFSIHNGRALSSQACPVKTEGMPPDGKSTACPREGLSPITAADSASMISLESQGSAEDFIPLDFLE